VLRSSTRDLIDWTPSRYTDDTDSLYRMTVAMPAKTKGNDQAQSPK